VARIQDLLKESRDLLGIPADYEIALLPGSDTGAFEAALWSLLGPRPVDVLDWDVFSRNWVEDVVEQLQLPEIRVLRAPFGSLPDLSLPDPSHDIVFVWNGTTSGVCLPQGDWISPTRTGLTFCDGTSAAFAVDLPWEKLDVTTYSWQKALGGEAAHGMLILSPRALERLNSYQPSWPIPRLFRLTQAGHWNTKLFKGHTLNTPSLLCIEDCWQALQWVKREGGLPALVKKVRKNGEILLHWARETPWISPLAEREDIASRISVCLKIQDKTVENLPPERQWEFITAMTSLLAQEKVAFDIKNHAFSVPSLRVWCGPTVETQDLQALLPWLDYAYHHTKFS
jgi:phosphoserine aminotransferase